MKPFHDETPYLWLLFQQPHLRKTVNTVIHLSKDKGLLWADGSQLPTKTDRQLCGLTRLRHISGTKRSYMLGKLTSAQASK